MTISTSPGWAKLERWAGWVGWIGLGIESVLWATLWSVSVQNLVILVGLAGVLILGVGVCAALLVVRYRKFTGTWYAFGGLVVTLALLYWAQGLSVPKSVEALRMMGTLGLIAAVPVCLILLLIHRDASVPLVGFILLIFLWGMLLASRSYGGPIQAFTQYLDTPEDSRLWWFQTLTCLLGLILPLGSLAFVAHLIRLLVMEVCGK